MRKEKGEIFGFSRTVEMGTNKLFFYFLFLKIFWTIIIPNDFFLEYIFF